MKCRLDSRYATALIAGILTAVVVWGEEIELIGRTPFLPAGVEVAALPTEDGPIELRGVLDDGENGLMFSILDTRSNTASWVHLNETGHSYVVRSHRYVGRRDEVTVDYQGRQLTLVRGPARVASSRGGSATLSQFANPAANAAVTRSVTTSPTAESERQRLDDIAAELARRRELRNQASTPAPQGN